MVNDTYAGAPGPLVIIWIHQRGLDVIPQRVRHLVWVAMSAAAGGVRVTSAGAVLGADHGSDPDDRQPGQRGDQGQDGDDGGFHRVSPSG